MNIKSVKTRLVHASEMSLEDLMAESLPDTLEDGSVIAVSSKVVALCQGRVADKNSISKFDLIKQEADYYYKPDLMNQWEFNFTILNNTFIPAAGIDESNADGYYVLWPEKPQKVANELREFLSNKYKVKKLGVIITDSTAMPPMRSGTIGIMLAHSGFLAVKHLAGKPDLFGRDFQVARSSIGGGLAAAANVVMGEGAEQTPIAIISDVPFVQFTNTNPSAKELEAVYISPKEDIYAPFILSADWQRGKAEDHINTLRS